MLPPKPVHSPNSLHSNNKTSQYLHNMNSSEVSIEDSSTINLDSCICTVNNNNNNNSNNTSENVITNCNNNNNDNNNNNNNNNDINNHDHSVLGDESNKFVGNSNLNEDSMMMLSQSIDSIHTIGTNNGTDGLEPQVRTLFVSGLPLDAKPRELYLLFRSFKGYLSSTLKPAGKNGKLTAPVGFVTFESREQAEEALSKLQGVKFDPDGNQYMRLEFAHSNTKVTKPKTNITPGFNQITNMNATHLSINNIAPHQTAGNLTGCCSTNLPGMMNNLPSSLLTHLSTPPNGTSNGTAGSNTPTYDPQNGMFNNGAEAMAAAAAAAIQWASIPTLSSICTGYDNTAYLTSAASLLQANNFRTILPNNLSQNGFSIPTANGNTMPSLQMVQAALAQAAAAATAFNPNSSLAIPTPPQAITNTSPSPCSLSNADMTTVRNSVTTTSPPQLHSSKLNSYQYAGNQPTLAQINSFVSNIQHHQQQQQQHHQQQQQQQALTKMQMNQYINTNPTVSPAAGNLPPQMTAAAIGLLGGYNSIIKELTGSDNHMPTSLPPYQTNVNY